MDASAIADPALDTQLQKALSLLTVRKAAIRAKGVLVFMAKQIFVSKDGYLKLQNELEHLKTVKRAEIAQAIKKARSFGDLSENSEYDEAKNEQAEIETKIAQLEETIKNATVLDDTQLKTDKVSVGNKVRIYNVLDDAEQEFSFVGSTKQTRSPQNSDDSPLRKALPLVPAKATRLRSKRRCGILKYTIIEIAK